MTSCRCSSHLRSVTVSTAMPSPRDKLRHDHDHVKTLTNPQPMRELAMKAKDAGEKSYTECRQQVTRTNR